MFHTGEVLITVKKRPTITTGQDSRPCYCGLNSNANRPIAAENTNERPSHLGPDSDRFNSGAPRTMPITYGDAEPMGLKVRAVVESIDETETRRLKRIKIVSRDGGMTVLMELPEALCESIGENQEIEVTIETDGSADAEGTRLYVRGTVFRRKGTHTNEIVGSVGGLRVILIFAEPIPFMTEILEKGVFYLAIA